ncbi:hypothetical protein OBBRIDRAFT_837298 [Obba rivulosa]|uniref:DUF1977 domain-containing protein n=1 Tax=Obba rivulosa TaxID=1052685 RepID=A0A8E2DGV9_9APHY|nr:hypothetical protein OBBRIDRAFT_837298 [Obba rivulosa]
MADKKPPTRQPQKRKERSTFWQVFPPLTILALMLLAPTVINRLAGVPSIPDFAFTQSPRFDVERHTQGLGIKYYVHGVEFSQHPVAAELARTGDKPRAQLRAFEQNVENAYKRELHGECQRGLEEKERRKGRVGTDTEKREVDAEPVESCEELQRLGQRRHLEL